MAKIILTSGARPNYVKLKPIADLLPEAIIVDSGQHYDYILSKVFFDELGIRKADYFLGCDKRKDIFFTDIVEKFSKILEKESPDKVVVFGDIDSTLAFALATKRYKTKLYHIESGLRSGDMEMPEELCRITVDVISDIRFCTEKSAINNLKKSGIKGVNIGNVTIDTLYKMKSKFNYKPVKHKKYAVLTLHRPPNVDNGETLFKILNKINEVVDIPIVYPKHPRVSFLKEKSFYGGIEIIGPMSYLDFHALIKNAEIVITDSGGIQEETSALGIPCVTVRTTTERPITIEKGSNVLCRDIVDLEKCVEEAMKKKGMGKDIWDGKAAKRIVKYIKED